MDAGPRPKLKFLEARDLRKSFGGAQALRGVDVDLVQGEVHGLIGANGAGKSTFVRILAGVVQPDAGTIVLDGVPCSISNPREAASHRLNFIHQELNLVPKFSPVQNIMLGLPKSKRLGIFLDEGAMRRRVEAAVARLGLMFPLNEPVERRTVAERWLISIARALVTDARLIAMDEPTASLSEREAQRLFRVIRKLADDGVAVLYVSHRLNEILELCDRVSVFKEGQVVSRLARHDLSKDLLVQAIVGRDVEALHLRRGLRTVGGKPILEARNLRRLPAVRDASIAVHEAEVLGIAGLVGSGRTELIRLLFGADRPTAGALLLDGKPVRFHSPADAIRRGIALVPEERRSQGLVLQKSVLFNINIASFRSARLSRLAPFIRRRETRRRARAQVDELQIKTPSLTTPVSALSGGNQQKVVLAKWLNQRVRVLILDEPTRGVDIGARSEMHRVMRDFAAAGVGVIVISSEFEELVGCDRIVVMAEGTVVGQLVGAEISEDAMLNMVYAHEVRG